MPTLAEGGRAGDDKPNWLLIGGLGVGAVILLVILMGGQGGQKGMTSGSSLNAALGSIQEQNLNIMGEVGKAEADLRAQLDAVNQGVIAGNVSGDLNRMVLSQMPGGQQAYWTVVGSPTGSAAFQAEYGFPPPAPPSGGIPINTPAPLITNV